MARNHQAGDRGQANCSDGGQPRPASGTALIPARFLPQPTVPPCIMTATRPKNFPLRFASPSSARSTAAAELRLSGPMTGEQKLGEGLRELPLVGKADVARTKGET